MEMRGAPKLVQSEYAFMLDSLCVYLLSCTACASMAFDAYNIFSDLSVRLK